MIDATRKGPMPLQVLGAGPETAQAAADAMSHQVFGRPFRFAPVAGGAVPKVRVVLAFQPRASTDGAALCRGAAGSASPDRRRLEALAAFCLGGEALSEVPGWVEGQVKPDQPEFRLLLAQMTRDLFGHNDEERRQYDDRENAGWR